MKKAGVHIKIIFLIILSIFLTNISLNSVMAYDQQNFVNYVGVCPVQFRKECVCAGKYMSEGEYCCTPEGGGLPVIQDDPCDGPDKSNVEGKAIIDGPTDTQWVICFCAEGYKCHKGSASCNLYDESKLDYFKIPCPIGQVNQKCNCNEELADVGEYCCESGPQQEPCEDTHVLRYKWYPSKETENPTYCGENSIDCPQPNPFIWNQKLVSDTSFLGSTNYESFFAVIPLFNNYYYLGGPWPNLVDYMTQEEKSDSLSDYPMLVEDYEKLSPYVRLIASTSWPEGRYKYDHHFCALPDSVDGPFATVEMDVSCSYTSDKIEFYCRNNIIRICIEGDPNCPWREDITSLDAATCLLPSFQKFTGSGSTCWQWGKYGKFTSQVNLPELANSGEGWINGNIRCNIAEDLSFPTWDGFLSSWLVEDKEFTLNPGYPDNTNNFMIFGNKPYNLTYNSSTTFPDPDDPSGTYCEGSQGYKLGYSQITRYWDPETKECAGDDFISDDYYDLNPPAEGSEDYRPDFIYQTVDEADFSQGFCEQSSIGFNVGNRVWNEEAKCCGDDDGSIYPDFTINGITEQPSTEDMENRLNNYHDCAKLVNNNYLCNMQTESTSSWESAQDKEGDIVYLSCYPPGTELVANDSTWFACGDILQNPNQYAHQFTGSSFIGEERMSFSDKTKHSYFCKPTATGQESIYECCMGENCKSDNEAGERYKTGESFYLTEENQMYYCTINTDKNNNNIITGPDIESTLWTNDLDFTNSQSCENTYTDYKWTGAEPYHDSENNQYFCCGEYDDSREYKNGDEILLLESYNDPEGIGICFNSTFQPNNQHLTTNKIYNETLIINGNLLGCAVDENNAISALQCSGEEGSCDPGVSYRTNKYKDDSKPFKDNNWMLDLDNWPNPDKEDSTEQPLIIDQNYCTIAEANGQKYYCSYDENWKQGDNRSHLSFIEWADTEEWEQTNGLVAGCCEPSQCWNGTECIDSQANNPMLLPYGTEEEPYRCINGAWKFSELKYTWDREQSGYCQENSQCLVNPSGIQGDPNNPQCINSNNFIGDHYCQDGEWTTRTKFLALQLLEIAPKNQPYTLYCDSYQNTLNKYNYNDIESFILYPRELNGTQFNSVNNFCILRYGPDDKVVIATSLNHPITTNEVNFLNVFEQNIQSCPTEHSGFDQCSSTPDYIYYNEEINSIIYSKIQLNLGDTPTNILTLFQDMIDFIIENFSPTISGTFDFIAETNNFDQLYTSNQDQVVAVRERIYPTQEHISLRYWGIGADICETIEIYDNNLGEQDYIQCQEDSGKYYISSNLQEGVNAWHLLTSKLRPKKLQ